MFRHYSFACFVAGLALSVPLQSQIVTTVAGNSSWGRVWHVVFDAAGNLYAADSDKHMVYKVTPTGTTTTIAGTGTAGYSGTAGWRPMRRFETLTMLWSHRTAPYIFPTRLIIASAR